MSQASISENSLRLEQLYLKKDYDGAISLLLKNKESYPIGQFHSLLGTLQLKNGNIPAARYNLEKAIKKGHTDTVVLNNLNFSKQKLGIDDISTSKSLVDGLYEKTAFLPSEIFTSASLLLAIVLCLIFIKSIKKNKIIIFLILAVASLPYFWQLNISSRKHYAIALKQTAVHEGPSKIFEIKYKLQSGTKVLLGRRQNDWFFIERPIDMAGWVKVQTLGLL